MNTAKTNSSTEPYAELFGVDLYSLFNQSQKTLGIVKYGYITALLNSRF